MLLQDHCEAVLHAANQDEFQRVLVRFAQDLGFGFMAAAMVYDRAEGSPEFVTVHNAPPAFLPAFFDASAGLVDPVMQHCKFSGLPIVWDQSTYARAGRGELWEEQAKHGYRTGISMALHLPRGRHFVFGVDGERVLPKQQQELARMIADFASVLMCAQEAAARVLLPTAQQPSALSTELMLGLESLTEGHADCSIQGVFLDSTGAFLKAPLTERWRRNKKQVFGVKGRLLPDLKH